MTEYCNFCNKNQHQVKQLVLGEKAGICDACITLCSRIISNEDIEKATTREKIEEIDPMELRDYLDMFVTSQETAKQILSVAVANHVKRINADGDILEKSNVLLLGPTGSGKTLLAKTIAGYLDVPFTIADATALTESGYHGEDVDSILVKLLRAAGDDVSLAERGIVFIDEIDKIAKKNSNSTKGVGSEGVQQSLLKLIEGTIVTVTSNKNTEEQVDIDTSNILFIASGAFTGIDKIKKKKKQSSQIGFTADVTDTCTNDVEFTDLIEFGMIPEFVSRFPIVAAVQELSKDDMLAVLSEVDNNLVTQYKHLFKIDKVRLTFDKEALRQVVGIAIAKKTGARSLRSIMEKVLLPHMFNISKYRSENINKVRITKSLINNPTEVKKK